MFLSRKYNIRTKVLFTQMCLGQSGGTCVYHVSPTCPADHLCDFITVYITSTRRMVVYAYIYCCPLVIRSPKMHFNTECKQGQKPVFSAHHTMNKVGQVGIFRKVKLGTCAYLQCLICTENAILGRHSNQVLHLFISFQDIFGPEKQ